MAARRNWHASRLVAILSVAAACVVGCAPDASKVIHGLKSAPILNDAPPDAVEIARADDRGSVDRPAGTTAVFASDRDPAELVAYYLRTYSSYGLRPETTLGQGSLEYDGCYREGDIDACVILRFQHGSPYLPDYYNLKVGPAHAGVRTFITVEVIGSARSVHTG